MDYFYTMTDIENDGTKRGTRGRRPVYEGDTQDTSYFSIKETRTVQRDGRRRTEAKSTSPNPGPRYKNLGHRVCPKQDCWWSGDSSEFIGHVEIHLLDEKEWAFLLEPMYLFEELYPESPAPVYKKTKHVDRDD